MTNATTSVSEVIVMAEPALPNASPILSANDFFKFDTLVWISFQDAFITKISSIPRPKSRNGNDVCTGPYGIPNREHIPTESINAALTEKRLIVVRQNWKDEKLSLNRSTEIITLVIIIRTRHSTQLCFDKIIKTYKNIMKVPITNLSRS